MAQRSAVGGRDGTAQCCGREGWHSAVLWEGGMAQRSAVGGRDGTAQCCGREQRSTARNPTDSAPSLQCPRPHCSAENPTIPFCHCLFPAFGDLRRRRLPGLRLPASALGPGPSPPLPFIVLCISLCHVAPLSVPFVVGAAARTAVQLLRRGLLCSSKDWGKARQRRVPMTPQNGPVLGLGDRQKVWRDMSHVRGRSVAAPAAPRTSLDDTGHVLKARRGSGALGTAHGPRIPPAPGAPPRWSLRWGVASSPF